MSELLLAPRRGSPGAPWGKGLAGAPVALLRRHVVTAACTAAVAIVAADLTGAVTYRPAAALVVVGACGAYARPRPGGASAGVLAASLQITIGIPDGAWVPLVFCTLAPWLAGRVVRARGELVVALAQRTRELELEQDAFARLDVRHERARVARELHDIVAHGLAVMVVQAGAGRIAVSDDPAHAAQRFSSIGVAGGRALTELAQLVDILDAENAERDDDHGRRLQRVLDQARAAGLDVHATPLPRGVELPADLEDIAHRVVQEGLTNTLKHAPGAEVRVRLAIRARGVEIDVRDHGARSRPTLAATGGGLGLIGLRERVSAVSGRLDAGPADGRGWRLHAHLPLGDRLVARAG